MNVWINGRQRTLLDSRDRGLQYGDGIFETMRVRQRRIRLLEFHLDRLREGCRRLHIAGPERASLHRELTRIAAARREGVLKLIVTRGSGMRGYRPTGRERCTRIIALHALPRRIVIDDARAVRLRICATALAINPRLAGLKTLNRLDSVLARAEWQDARVWDGLMGDGDGNWVSGTMSNLFLRRGAVLTTPRLDRCGVAGVMRRWILERAGELNLRTEERGVRWGDLRAAEEVFMSNAVVGIKPVRAIEWPRKATLRYSSMETADRLRALLDIQ
jgi:4-amino-4-deoxychorismate lyase